MPNSRFALHGKRPSLIHGLCAFFASNSRFMRLFPAAPDTPLDSPFSATLSVHGLHFTVYAPSNLWELPIFDPSLRFANIGRIVHNMTDTHTHKLCAVECLLDNLWTEKSSCPQKFLSAILGPEMGAPILWTPGKCVLSTGKNHVRKIPLF